MSFLVTFCLPIDTFCLVIGTTSHIHISVTFSGFLLQCNVVTFLANYFDPFLILKKHSGFCVGQFNFSSDHDRAKKLKDNPFHIQFFLHKTSQRVAAFVPASAGRFNILVASRFRTTRILPQDAGLGIHKGEPIRECPSQPHFVCLLTVFVCLLEQLVEITVFLLQCNVMTFLADYFDPFLILKKTQRLLCWPVQLFIGPRQS